MSNEIPTIQASATLFAIVLGGTDSLLNIHLNNGFKFEKINIFDSPFKDKYVNASGQLLGNYCFCQLPPSSKNQAHFICLTKSDNVPCSIMAFTLNEMHSLNLFSATMDEWKKLQEKYIRELLSIMRLFKEGNIEISNVFYRFDGRYRVNRLHLNSECQHADKGEVFDNFYELTDSEAAELNQIIVNNVYCLDILKNVIDKFEVGCKEFRNELAFKELITVGETLFLNYNSHDNAAKKAKLANRLAAWIGKNDLEVKSIHDDMVTYYEYRSDDTHESTNDAITATNRKKLREYMRAALKKYIAQINIEKQSNPTCDFHFIRQKIVSNIINDVSDYQSRGIL